MAEARLEPSVAVYGLAVMGSNLARNIESRGIPVAVYNRTTSVTEGFLKEFNSDLFYGATSLEELVNTLARPRKIILMIQAGAAIDHVLNDLLPLLSPDDIVIDGGNTYYKETVRRVEEAKKAGVHFLGVGISGGEEGALNGPSIMPGGKREAWQEVSSLFSEIAAKVGDEPCTDYVGPDGAGHFVKMVHNGIEYADMQLIAEVYHMLHSGFSLSNSEIGDRFAEWNQGRLSSYLMEITSSVFKKGDEGGDGDLIDKILDKAGQKGTGRWTVQEGLHLGIPIPTIAAAVDARSLSYRKDERVRTEEVFRGKEATFSGGVGDHFPTNDEGIAVLEQALYVGKVVAYAQGMALIREASIAFDWSLELDRVAALWRGGCIIRAELLKDVMAAFHSDPNLENLITFPNFTEEIIGGMRGLRDIVSLGSKLGIPLPGLSSSLAYLDAYTTGRLPQNLIQAQRDFFGAHTYERTDKKGVFHTEW